MAAGVLRFYSAFSRNLLVNNASLCRQLKKKSWSLPTHFIVQVCNSVYTIRAFMEPEAARRVERSANTLVYRLQSDTLIEHNDAIPC